jgi:hypothetical protein
MDGVCPYDRDATVDKIVKARVPKLNDVDASRCGTASRWQSLMSAYPAALIESV